MAHSYPPIEPYEHGYLDVGDGHVLYWETCGNPNGKPAVVLHGGPGAGCSAGNRRPFNPDLYRIVLFDQRGSGRSTPLASESEVDLSTNTTEHLISDIERLREHLSIDKWLVFGGSWGTTLGLAYAERHPTSVSEMILAFVTMTTPWEVAWITEGVGQFFPEALDRFRAGLPEEMREHRLVDAYYQLLLSPDPDIHDQAARDWCAWEAAIVDNRQENKPSPRYEDPAFRLTFARLVTHYFSHAAWIEDGQLLRDAHHLADIPGVLIHGRMDLTAPLITAWKLSQAWPGSELVILNEAGHSGADPGMTEALVAATDRFARS